MAKTGLEQVFLGGSVTARRFAFDQPLCFSRRYAEVEDEIFTGKAVDAVLEMLDPGQELGTLRRRDTSGLMGEVGTDVAVHQNNLAFVQGGFDFRLGFEAVPGINQPAEVPLTTLKRT